MNALSLRAAAVGWIGLLVLSASAGCEARSPEPPADPFAAADSLRGEGRHGEALPRYRRLRDSLRAAGDSAGLWRAEVWSAHAFVHTGQLDSARRALSTADELAEGDPAREARTRWVQSLWLDRQGRLQDALRAAERARELALEAGDERLEAAAYNALGRIHSLRGRYREALEVHERYLDLEREIGGPASVALALNEIGIDYRNFGRFGDAVRTYEEALEIYRRVGDPEGQAMVLYNLANVHIATGEVERALSRLRESLEHAVEIGHVYGQGLLHNNLGGLYLQEGNLEAARRHLERSREIHAEAGLAYGRAVSLRHLGELELESGRPDSARRLLREALTWTDSLGFRRQRIAALTLLSRLEARAGNSPEAMRLADEAVEAADSLADPGARYEALVALARARETAGRDDALAIYRHAMDLLESWRGRLALGDLRMGVTAPRIEAYEGAVRILMTRGRPSQAFVAAERARARLLLELVTRHAREPEQMTPADSLRVQLRLLYRRWKSAEPGERSDLERRIESVGASLAEFEAGSPGGRTGVVTARPPGAADGLRLRSRLEDSGRALLTYFWGERHAYGWRVDGGGVVGARLGPVDSLRPAVEFLRAALARPGSGVEWKPPARRVYRLLIRPLEPAPGAELWVVPAGPLARLPFEVLVPPEAERPLGVERLIRYGSSASVLQALAGDRPTRRWRREALVTGVPEPPSLPAVGRSGEAPEPSLPPLPHAGEEARAIHDLFAEEDADLLLGAEASVRRWLGMRPGRYRYLHFATHARVSDRRPEQTHLVLADGRLDLPALRDLSLRADLAVLSACETGLGRSVRGEGIIGLPYAFLAAGARGVVVSLWRVADRSAAEFMERFYQELRAGASPAAALRDVRRRFLAGSGPPSHPSTWAPFILVGGIDG